MSANNCTTGPVQVWYKIPCFAVLALNQRSQPTNSITTITQKTQTKTNRLRYYNLQLETALCYQHCFCNTDLRNNKIE